MTEPTIRTRPAQTSSRSTPMPFRVKTTCFDSPLFKSIGNIGSGVASLKSAKKVEASLSSSNFPSETWVEPLASDPSVSCSRKLPSSPLNALLVTLIEASGIRAVSERSLASTLQARRQAGKTQDTDQNRMLEP